MDFEYGIATRLKEKNIDEISNKQISISMNNKEKTSMDDIICNLSIRLNRLMHPKSYMKYAIQRIMPILIKKIKNNSNTQRIWE